MIGDSCLNREKRVFSSPFSTVDGNSYMIVTVNFEESFTTGASQERVTMQRYCWRRHRIKYPWKTKGKESGHSDREEGRNALDQILEDIVGNVESFDSIEDITDDHRALKLQRRGGKGIDR